MKIHALWCHPRSMSTAVERIMRERGDLEVLHEPFMYHYYLGGDREKFTDFAPEADHPTSYEGIRAMIRERAEAAPVFFKDMGYYVHETLGHDPGFAGEMSHAFLIRDPREAVISYAKRQPDFTAEEVGIEAQWQLYAALRGMGLAPTILFSEDIRRNPGAEMARYWAEVGLADATHALSWDASVPEGWKSVETWHRKVLETTAILPPDEGRDVAGELAALGAPYRDYAAHHQVFFDRFRAAHQK